jgi:hypothetical protein
LTDGEAFGSGCSVFWHVLACLHFRSESGVTGYLEGFLTHSNASLASLCAAGYLCSGAKRYSTDTMTQGADIEIVRQKSMERKILANTQNIKRADSRWKFPKWDI